MSDILKVGHLNVYHLINKIPDVCNLLNNNLTTHIFGLCETKIRDPKTKTENNDKGKTDNSDDDNDFEILSIPNYNKPFYRHMTEKLQTGLVLYIHNSIRHLVTRRMDLENNKIEAIWIEIRQPNLCSKLLGYVYRNPAADNSFFDDFTDMIDKAAKITTNITLLGDFNFNLLKPTDKPQQRWSSIIEQLGLKQFVDKPTRYDTQHNTWTLIDHIYSSDSHAITDVKVSNSSISDHNPVFCSWTLKHKKLTNKGHKTVEYRSFKNFNELAFLHDISLINFDKIYNINCPNKAFDYLNETLLTVVNKHAPIRKKRVKNHNLPPWLTKEITSEMSLRDKYKSNKDFENYKKQRNKVTMLVRKAKQMYIKKIVGNSKDTRQIWNGMNEITNKKKTQNNQPQILLTPNELNDYFLTCPRKLVSSSYGTVNNTEHNIDERLQKYCEEKLTNKDNFTIPLLGCHEVGKLIYKLKNKRSVGPDEISTYIVKITLPYILEHLTYAYNLSIEQNTFPSSFKVAKVIPIPKSKDLTDPSFFRPISILSVLSKPLERHIHTHLLKHMETHQLFMPSQSGFRPKHSCQTAIMKMCDAWLAALNRGETAGVVFLDFSKAFDVVNHAILLKKLSLYLPNSKTISFFQSYLSGRSQFVYLNCKKSKPGTICSGVPQGSILGPLLFCIFINDLPFTNNNDSTTNDMFADDSSIYTSDIQLSVIENKLQLSLNHVFSWCKNNQMILNPKKSKCMIVATRQRNLRNSKLNLFISDTKIEQVSQHKVLGITVDSELKWLPHIENIHKK